MKRIASVLPTLLACCLPLASAAPEPGEPAPNVLLPFLDGTSAELAEWLGGNPVYLKMWATWCSTCREEMPHFRATFEKYKDDIAFLSVNAGFNDSASDIRAFNREYGLEMPSVIDVSGDIGEAFELRATPYHVLIDASGTIVHTGHKASETVDRLLAGMAQAAQGGVKPPSSPVTGDVSAADRPHAGDAAPPFSIETLSGTAFDVGEDTAPGEPLYLLFFTTWCEPYLFGAGDDPETAGACRDTRRAVEAAFAGADRPPRVLGIASRMWTGTQELIDYRERFDPPYPVAIDETNAIFQSYGVRRFPTLVVISGGRVAGRYTGGLQELPVP